MENLLTILNATFAPRRLVKYAFGYLAFPASFAQREATKKLIVDTDLFSDVEYAVLRAQSPAISDPPPATQQPSS